MSLTDAEEIALPIDDVDQVLAPGLSFAVIWVDLSEQPDLQVLAEQDTLADGFSTGTWFYDSPGKQNMRIVLRVEMSPATIIEQVVASRGQSLFITLLEHMIVELREKHGSSGSA